MKPILIALSHRLTGEPFDARAGQLACVLGGISILPVAILALVRHPGSQAEFLLGLSPVQVTLGLLLIGSLSLAILVVGMMTTVVRSPKR